MGDERQIFETYLKKQGLNLTDPRHKVLAAVFSTHDHFTADDLIHRLEKQGTPVSKATVYRTLSLLSDCNLLLEHDFGQGRAIYEHASALEHHGHLFCTDCGAISEFFDARVNTLLENTSRQEGFQPAKFAVKIYGLCSRCAEKRDRAGSAG
jgi:Fur family ferric uptake transcriptional regulator